MCIRDSSKDITRTHVELVQKLFAMQTGRSMNLPYQVVAERTYGGVRLQKCEKQPEHKIKMCIRDRVRVACILHSNRQR